MTFDKITYRSLWREAEEAFRQAGIEEAKNDAALLLMHCFGIDKSRFFLDLDRKLGEAGFFAERLPDILAAFRTAAAERIKRFPLDYILGEKYFYGRPFFVEEGVLIPRFDTEVLVERILLENRDTDIEVLDLCTGSGCIAVSLKLSGGYRRVSASDISPHALSVAGKNARRLGAQVDFIESDLFENIRGRYDLIVSNPPYIGQEEFATLMPEVRLFEPTLALFASEEGVGVYRQIREKFASYLKPGGKLYLETGAGQRKAIETLFSGYNLFYEKDLSGHDRTVRIER